MPKWTTGRLPAAADERGVAAVEFALVLPVLILVLFGTITGGLAFSNAIGMTNAVREGARFGATADKDSGSWLSDVQARTRALQFAGSDRTTVCVQGPGSGPSCSPATTDAPAPGGWQGPAPAGDCVVRVWARQNFHIEMGIFGDIDGVIHKQAASRYERGGPACS